jgi:aminotransferase
MIPLQERLSPIVRDLPPSGIRRFFDIASQMDDVISLGVGEPDFVTPWHVREAGIYSLERGYTMYTSNRGLPELCQAISEYLEGFELHYDPLDEIFVTVGASEAIDVSLRALVCPGDEVLIPEPAYVSYRPCALLAGAKVTGIPTKAEEGFRLTASLLKSHISPKSKILILCYPNNPTGAVMDMNDLQEIAKVAIEHDLIVISDEIYAELSYDKKHASIASLPGMKERTILINGMSKAFAMTGWRLGYVAAPKEVLDALLKIHQYTILCAPIMVQKAALEALKNGKSEMQRMVESYNQRRKLITKGFQDIGLSCHEAKGAFYAFPSVHNTGLTSTEFAEGLLQYSRVAVVPGNVFGEAGEGFIRCSYATSVEQIERALERIDHYVQSLK